MEESKITILQDIKNVYENLGMRMYKKEISALEAAIQLLKMENKKWIPVENPPKSDDFILLSFENFPIPLVGRYEADEEGGAYYEGNSMKPLSSQMLFVNGWQPLPDNYRPLEDA